VEIDMTGEAFEYAIKKDVRNNPIVRELDREKHRELWRTMLVGLFLVAALMFSVWRQVGLLQHGYGLPQLEAQLEAEKRENQRLRAAQAQLRAPARIEEVATRRLHMRSPSPDEHDVIPRAFVGSPPPRTAVARH
jgi:cell division protein FtsL